MKIAIIGAGLSGLACAHELEKLGETPVIFERFSDIGEQFSHVGATLEVIGRPIRDSVKYMQKSFGIDIKPINTVNKLVHKSPNKTTEIKGKLGYFFMRSKEPSDMKVQLHSKLKNTEIVFDTKADYNNLSKEFDYVVDANGFTDITCELGCWFEWINMYVKGAVVLGEYDPNTLIVWLNKDYCKNGYAYLCPFSENRASLVLVVSDVTESEVNNYWDLFLTTENIKNIITEEFKINHRSGYVYPHKIGNIYLTGNAAGTIDPFLGFGIINSIFTGVMAARSIVSPQDYEKLIAPVDKMNKQLYEFRKKFNNLENSDFDLLLTAIGLPVVKHITYYTPINIVKLGSFTLRSSSKNKL